jgi:hypothetical protein
LENKDPSYTTYTNELAKSASPLLTPAQFVLGFLKWWYIDAITAHLRFFKRLVEILFDRLSITLLLKTFFVPWHRTPDAFGIIFGIVMRLIWIPFALIIVLLVIAVGVLFVLLWMFLPFITIYNIIFFWI